MDNRIPPLLQATSGALGSAVGNALVFPLDLATTHLQLRRSSARKLSLIQTLHRLVQRQSPRRLYAGLKADTLSTLISSFLYFLAYSSLHKLALRRPRHRRLPGGASGTIPGTSLGTIPGNGLGTGKVTASGIGSAGSPAGIGGMTTKASAMGSPRPLGAIEELVIGLVAGVVSKGLTLPLSAIAIRQQLGSASDAESDSDTHHGGRTETNPNHNHNITTNTNDSAIGNTTTNANDKTNTTNDHTNDRAPTTDNVARAKSTKKDSLTLLQAIQAMYNDDGLSGMFAALPPSIPLALLPSLTLYIHTLLLRLLVPARHRAHPKATTTFLLGAASNALATVPLYPLVLLKTISQAGPSRRSGPSGQPGPGQSQVNQQNQKRDARNQDKATGGMLHALEEIVRTQGVAGLYKGIEGQLVKGIVQQGVMMLLKQRIEESVVWAYRTLL